MIKNKEKRKEGFTLVEVLVSMAITMIILAAMVPMIGTKKIKNPSNKSYHGVFECYYENGKLMQYEANNQKNKRGKSQEIEGNYCTFVPPKADFYEVIAIGAGGAGYGSVLGQSTSNIGFVPVTSAAESTAGTIDIDSDYQSDIDEASRKSGLNIREYINKWSGQHKRLTAEYKNIYGPTGKGGSGDCSAGIYPSTKCLMEGKCKLTGLDGSCGRPYRKNPNNLLDYFSTTEEAVKAMDAYNPEELCWYYVHGHGENSGKASRVPDQIFHIDGNSKITLEQSEERTLIKIDDDYVELTPSEEGRSTHYVETGGGFYYASGKGDGSNTAPKDGDCLSNTGRCKNKTISDKVSHGASGGEEVGLSMKCNSKPGEYPKKGTAYFIQPTIEWHYTGYTANITIGEKGEYGEVGSIIYEKLKDKLYLFPAKDSSQSSFVSQIPDGGEKILTVKSGQSRTGTTTISNVKLTEETMPVPDSVKEAVVPDNEEYFSEYLRKIKSSPFKGGVAKCGTSYDSFKCPGFASSGVYPFIDSIEGSNTLTLKDRQGNMEPGVFEISNLKTINVGSTCADGTLPKNGLCSSIKTKYPNGQGAVIIMW